MTPRTCPACQERHPALTTCAGGWMPWVPDELAHERWQAAEREAYERVAQQGAQELPHNVIPFRRRARVPA